MGNKLSQPSPLSPSSFLLHSMAEDNSEGLSNTPLDLLINAIAGNHYPIPQDHTHEHDHEHEHDVSLDHLLSQRKGSTGDSQQHAVCRFLVDYYNHLRLKYTYSLPINVLDHAKLFPLDNVKCPSLWRLKLCSIQDLRQPMSLLDPSTRITTISLVLWKCGIRQQVKRAMVKREGRPE